MQLNFERNKEKESTNISTDLSLTASQVLKHGDFALSMNLNADLPFKASALQAGLFHSSGVYDFWGRMCWFTGATAPRHAGAGMTWRRDGNTTLSQEFIYDL